MLEDKLPVGIRLPNSVSDEDGGFFIGRWTLRFSRIVTGELAACGHPDPSCAQRG